MMILLFKEKIEIGIILQHNFFLIVFDIWLWSFSWVLRIKLFSSVALFIHCLYISILINKEDSGSYEIYSSKPQLSKVVFVGPKGLIFIVSVPMSAKNKLGYQLNINEDLCAGPFRRVTNVTQILHTILIINEYVTYQHNHEN